MPPDTHTTSSPLRWLAIATGVAGLHLALVHALWRETDPQVVEERTTDAHGLSVSGVLLPPLKTVTPTHTPKHVQAPVAADPSTTDTPVAPSNDTTVAVAAHVPTPEIQDTEPEKEAAATPATAPSLQARASPPATDAQWQYDVNGTSKGFQYQATATMRWHLDAQRYDMQLSLGAFLVGSRSQHSQGKVGPHGLQPDRFLDKARRERQLHFDWAHRTVQSPEQAVGRPLAEGTQDRLSVFMQLASVLAALHQTPHNGQIWKIPVAGFGTTEDWVFRFEGIETQDLPAGQFQTWKLHYQTPAPRGQSVELWFAPELQHLPVRIRMSQDNGDVVDQRLNSR